MKGKTIMHRDYYKHEWRLGHRGVGAPDSRGGRHVVEEAVSAVEDIQLECVDCATAFTFTVGEQEFFLDRQFLDEQGRLRRPIRCRAAASSAGASDGRRSGARIGAQLSQK